MLDSTAASGGDDAVIIRQIARKLHAEHAKRARGVVVGWKNTSIEERKLWWSLAKSAVHLMKKHGVAQP